MSFVYIDSQGREVKIPSVDAVRLRIELGAIKDQTRFFDSNTGRWAPAAEHEIYRTLKRELIEAEQGFVAPPPPSVAPGPPKEGTGEPEDAPSPAATAEPEEAGGGDGTAGSGEAGDLPGAAADDGREEPDHGGEEPGAEDHTDFGGLSGLEVAPLDEVPGEEPTEGAWQEAAAAPRREEGGDDPEEESFVTSAEDELLGDLEGHGAGTLDDRALDLEPSLADSFSADGGGAPPPEAVPSSGPGWGDEPDLPLEDEWSAGADPDEPPEEAGPGSDAFDGVWDSPDDHGREAGPEAFSSAPDPAPAEALPVEEAGPRPGGAPPQRKLTRARPPGADRIVGIVALVAVLGAALFFGWRFLAPALSGGGGEAEIAMPPLDQELVPRMRQLAGRASGRMAQDMLGLPQADAVPEEPSEDWLAGIYLAGASEYPNVPDYWRAIRDWVEAARTSENALFREALLAQLDTANLAASDAQAIRDRALAGFQAASTDRRVVYDQMQQVADRSIVLHEFLVANEDQISYEPAGSGISRDPVLEAVPSSEALGDEMWEMVGSITDAMDALGYLDRIDTDRLVGVFLEKLQATAIR